MRYEASLQKLITTKEVVRKLKKKAKVMPSKVDIHDDQLERDMDDLTPGTLAVHALARHWRRLEPHVDIAAAAPALDRSLQPRR